MSNDRKQRAEQMRKEREKADKRQRNVITIAIVAVVIALVGVGGYAVKSTADKNAKSTDLVAPKNTKDYGILYDQADAESADGGSSDGDAASGDAKPVSVEVYEDFQCPVCQQFEQVAGPMLKQQVASGEIALTYKPFSFPSVKQFSPRKQWAIAKRDNSALNAEFKKKFNDRNFEPNANELLHQFDKHGINASHQW